MRTNALTPRLLNKTRVYWRAANYFSVGQIHLWENLLLKQPLPHTEIEHVLSGHQGKTQGQNLIHDRIYVSGPRASGPDAPGNTYLDGTYGDFCPGGIPGCERIPLGAGLLYPFFGLVLSQITAGVTMSLSTISVVGITLHLGKGNS